jgi:hypothetical protein
LAIGLFNVDRIGSERRRHLDQRLVLLIEAGVHPGRDATRAVEDATTKEVIFRLQAMPTDERAVMMAAVQLLMKPNGKTRVINLCLTILARLQAQTGGVQ